jgi:uncharacterized membrane protein
MDWLASNAFFVILLVLCIGMHFFHGRGHDGHDDDEHSNKP